MTNAVPLPISVLARCRGLPASSTCSRGRSNMSATRASSALVGWNSPSQRNASPDSSAKARSMSVRIRPEIVGSPGDLPRRGRRSPRPRRARRRGSSPCLGSPRHRGTTARRRSAGAAGRPRVGAMPMVLLVRHGRTAANAGGVLAGWTPGVTLDDRGREQAAAAGDRLRPVPLSWSSPVRWNAPARQPQRSSPGGTPPRRSTSTTASARPGTATGPARSSRPSRRTPCGGSSRPTPVGGGLPGRGVDGGDVRPGRGRGP